MKLPVSLVPNMVNDILAGRENPETDTSVFLKNKNCQLIVVNLGESCLKRLVIYCLNHVQVLFYDDDDNDEQEQGDQSENQEDEQKPETPNPKTKRSTHKASTLTETSRFIIERILAKLPLNMFKSIDKILKECLDEDNRKEVVGLVYLTGAAGKKNLQTWMGNFVELEIETDEINKFYK